ncbi:MAG TPA: Crp/Fnr family transcriptional regulator [Brevibacillus sp.]|nr:Crp/Fnr family transcriptional regulator [Brevibacillus sp.]
MSKHKYAWKPYLARGLKKTYPPKTILFHQGEIGNGFYYLEDGEVKIQLTSFKGDERIIDIVTPGELFGEAGIKKEPYFSTAYVMKPSTLFYFSNEVFQQICREHPSAIDIFLQSLIRKERLLAEIVAQENRSFEQKLAFFLLKLYNKNKDTNIAINQISLSNYIGTSRITVYKILQQWEKKEIVTVSNRSIQINDLNRLRAILNDDIVIPSVD